jgi:hypothetical protein
MLGPMAGACGTRGGPHQRAGARHRPLLGGADGQPEVGQLDGAAAAAGAALPRRRAPRRQQHVLGLEVAVQDALLWCVCV